MLYNYEKMKASLRGWLQGRGYFTAMEAMDFAEQYHTGIRKDGKTPEFAHQVSIVSYLRTLEPHLLQPEKVFAVGFLHDVIEDYVLMPEDLPFDSEIREAVVRLSRKLAFMPFLPKRDKVEYYAGIAVDPIASIVKGADRVHNFQTMVGVFSEQKQREYIAEYLDFIKPSLHTARNRFPRQEPAYENVKLILVSQVNLIEAALSE